MRQRNTGGQAADRWWLRMIVGSLVVAGLLHGRLSMVQAQELEWAIQAGGPSFDMGSRITVDDSGNSYVTGTFEGTATFGEGELNETTLTSAGSLDVFVAKYDSAGTLVWATQAGGTGQDQGTAIAVDGSGNSIVTGFFFGTATFGQMILTAAGSGDVFVAKYDSAGTLVWATRAGGGSFDAGDGIGVDGNGNSVVTGLFEGAATFGPLDTLTSAGSRDVFVAKYDSAGTLVWATQAGGTGQDEGNGIAVDGDGNSYVTGFFRGTATFGPLDTLTSAGASDVFVAKYDSAGTLVWATQAGGTGQEEGMGIGVDGNGNSVVAGFFAGTATFGAGEPNETTLASAGANDVFVAKYDSAGTLVWATQAGGTGQDQGIDIAIDGSGNSVVTGLFEGTATFGAGEPNETTLASAGSADIFVAKYDSAGTLVWATQAGGTGQDQGNGVAVDGDGNSHVNGTFAGTATFGAGEPNETTLTSAGSADIFVAKFRDQPADLAITKQAPATLKIQIGGQANLTYTIGIKNIGPGVASGVMMTDPLPSGTTFVSADPSQGSCSTPAVGAGGTVSCNVGTLSTSASATITLVVKVRRSLLTLKTITNKAIVSAGTYDPNSANNAATAKTLVVGVLNH